MLRAAVQTLLEAVASVVLGLLLVFGVGLLLSGSVLEWLWSFFLSQFLWAVMAVWAVVLALVAARRGRRAGVTQLSLSALAAGVVGCAALCVPILIFAAEHPDSVTSIGMSWIIIVIAAGFFLAFYLATFPVGALANTVFGRVTAPERPVETGTSAA